MVHPTIGIGYNGAGMAGNTQIIGIGNATSGTTNITIGNTAAGTTTLQGATGILLGNNGATNTATTVNGTALVKTGTNSATALQVQNAAGVAVTNVDTTANKVTITGTLNLAQTAAPGAATVAVGAAGVLTGAYYYVVSFVTASGETDAVINSASVSPSSQQVNLTAIPTGTVGLVTARKIYRTTAGENANGPYYLVTTLADDVTTTYTDNTADGSLGAATAPFDNHTADLQIGGVTVLSASNNANGALNTWVGILSGASDTEGLADTALGYGSLQYLTNGGQNTAVGTASLQSLTWAWGDTAIGESALGSTTTGDGNIGVGDHAGMSNTYANANVTGIENTFIGDFAGPGSPIQLQYSAAIGSMAVVNSSNTIALGCTSGVNTCPSTTNIGIASGGYANNPLTVSAANYSAGTISQSASVNIVGTSTVFQPYMAGGTIYYNDGTSDTIASYTDGTHSATINSHTESGTYAIVWGGMNVLPTGQIEVMPTAINAGALELNMVQLAGTVVNGELIDQKGTGGTTTNGLQIRQNAGTLTNGILFGGTIGTDITTAGGIDLTVVTDTTGAATFDTGTTGQVNIGTNANAKTIQIGNGAADTVNIGNGNFAELVTVGSTNASATLTLEGGTAANAIQIGNGATAHGIQIGNGAAIQTIVIGSTNNTSTTTLNGGNSAAAVSIQAAAGGTLSVGTVNNNNVSIGTAAVSGAITIGGSGTTGTITVGQWTGTSGTSTISIGGTVGTGGTQAINLGNSGTGTTNLTIGSTVAGTTTIVGGTNVVIGTGGNTVTFSGSTGEPTLAGTARHTRTIKLTAEYAGAVLDAQNDTAGGTNCSTSNAGTMTSGLDWTNHQNYYDWTSTNASTQCYDVVVAVPLPADFSAWAASNPISVQTYVDSTANAILNYDLHDTSNAPDGTAFVAATPGSASTWTAFNAASPSGTYAANGTITIRIRMSSKSSANARIGTITLTYLSKY